MKKVEPIAELRRRLDGKTQAALASELGISVTHLCDILNGRRAVGPIVLKALGLERVVTFRPISSDRPSA